LQVIEAVELRADLEGARDEFGHPVQRVVAPAAALVRRAAGVDDVRAADERVLPVAPLEAWHIGVQRPAEVVDRALAHQAGRGDDLSRGDLVEAPRSSPAP
jgi:hypothetical protein